MPLPDLDENRKLPFNLQFPVIQNEAISDNVVPQLQWPTADDTEQVAIVIRLSLQEYATLASAVDVGRDIAYSSDSDKVWLLWLRIIDSMSICSEVADCITNDDNVKAAINQQIIEAGAGSPNTLDPDTTSVDDRFPASARDETIADGYTDCDNDYLWAGVKEIVLRLDDNARNILENAQVIADIGARYVNVIQAIPIIGNLAASVAKNFIQVIPDILDSFNAYSSTEHVEDLSCELFELVCDTCEYPTFQQVADTIATHCFSGLLSWETASLSTVIADFLVVGSFTPSIVWHSMLMLELYAFYLGASVNGYSGNKAVTMWAKLGEDEPSADWETLCDACAPEVAIPEIVVSCAGGGSGGTITSLGGNRYRFTATARATDKAITLHRQGGGAWHLENVGSVVGSSTFYAWQIVGGSCAAGASPPDPETSAMIEFAWTQPLAASPTFQFEADFLPS